MLDGLGLGLHCSNMFIKWVQWAGTWWVLGTKGDGSSKLDPTYLTPLGIPT